MKHKNVHLTLFAIFLFLALPCLLMAESQPLVIRDPQMNGCQFTDLTIPDDLQVYLAGGERGQEIGLQIDKSGHQATLMKVLINRPQRPVALFLAAYEPTIWEISWTKDTPVVAVVLTGYHRQIITGLPENIPVINSTYNNKACDWRFFIDTDNNTLPVFTKLSKELFASEPTDMVKAVDGSVHIGHPASPNQSIITPWPFKTEDWRDPQVPLTGKAGLNEALDKDLIRLIDGRDYHKWPLTWKCDPSVEANLNDNLSASHSQLYLVLSPDFIIPADLYGANAVTFYLPPQMDTPKGEPGHSRIIKLKEGICDNNNN